MKRPFFKGKRAFSRYPKNFHSVPFAKVSDKSKAAGNAPAALLFGVKCEGGL